MAILGIYTTKEVEQIKQAHENEKRLMQLEIDGLTDTNEMFKAGYNTLTEMKNKEIAILKAMLHANNDKSIERLEALQKRVKKEKVKKKIENRISERLLHQEVISFRGKS